MANGGDLANRPTASRDSVTFGQTPLSGNTIPKFVDRLPTLPGGERRHYYAPREQADDSAEGPPRFGCTRRFSPLQERNVSLGYDINGAGPSWPARTIEARKGIATTVSYTNSLANTGCRTAHGRSVAALGRIRSAPREGQLRERPARWPRLARRRMPVPPCVVHLTARRSSRSSTVHPEAWFTPARP